jgi:ABC-type dipeptide/oligopeptide/nickel transport system permease subunit
MTDHPIEPIERGSSLGPVAPAGPVAPPSTTEQEQALGLVYEHGLEVAVRSQWAYVRRRFVRHRLAMGSLVVLIFVLLAGAFASVVAPYGYAGLNVTQLLQGPSWSHPFGTDLLGRDDFSRVLYGIRTTEKVAFLVGVLSVVIGTTVGALAGYYGKWVDNLLMRFVDLVLTLPGLAVLLTISSFIKSPDPVIIALILAALFWTVLARIVRGQFLSLREKEYVEAAKAAGAGDLRIMFRHMLPNTLGPIIVNGTLTVAAAILTEAYLSFLGFGIQPPTPALGRLINDGNDAGQAAWWLTVFPGLTIVLIVLCINFVGDGLRDALDPTQRKVRA